MKNMINDLFDLFFRCLPMEINMSHSNKITEINKSTKSNIRSSSIFFVTHTKLFFNQDCFTSTTTNVFQSTPQTTVNKQPKS